MNNEETFQQQVAVWLTECFGPQLATDKNERNHRFLEESLELGQACGCTEEDAIALVRYVYGRPAGEPLQELGGVMTTLHALANAHNLDATLAAKAELARCWLIIDKIRAKRALKPKIGPLPIPMEEVKELIQQNQTGQK